MFVKIIRICILIFFNANIVCAMFIKSVNEFEIAFAAGYAIGIMRNAQLPDGNVISESIENTAGQEFSLGQGYKARVGLNYKINGLLGLFVCGQYSSDKLSDGIYTYSNVSCYSFGGGPQFNATWPNGLNVWFRTVPGIYFPNMRWVSLYENYQTSVDFSPAFGLGGSVGGGKKAGVFEIGFEINPEIVFSRINEITRTYTNGASDRWVYEQARISLDTGTALRDRIWYNRQSHFFSASSLAILLTVSVSADNK